VEKCHQAATLLIAERMSKFVALLMTNETALMGSLYALEEA
jgi:hypothetical protein